MRWGRLALSAGGAIVRLALGIAFDSLIRDLFARADWLGWLSVALIALFVLALLAIVGRELAGLFRLKRLARLRLQGDEAAGAQRPRRSGRRCSRALLAPLRRPAGHRARRAGSSPAISARSWTGATC